MRTLLTTAACAALVAALGSTPAAAQQASQDTEAASEGQAVSPDEYFGIRPRSSSQQPDQDSDGDVSADSLNAEQLRRLRAQRERREAARTQTDDGMSMADRLRQRDEERRSGQGSSSNLNVTGPTGGNAADAAQMTSQESGVEVTITGVRANGGDVYVALQTEDSFASEGGEYTQVVEPNGTRATATFDSVPPGDYAVAVFQDTDGDGTVTLDQTGPTEPWGLSGDVSGTPTFDDAMFTLDEGQQAMERVRLTGGTAASMNATGSETVATRAPRTTTSAQDDATTATAAASTGEPSRVTVTITGLEDEGKVFVALQDEAGFATAGGAYTKTARVRDGEAEVTFRNVEPGDYAVAVFQDTDGDGTVTLTDTGPTEPWGFSGDVTGTPAFDDAAFTVDGDTDAEVEVQPGSADAIMSPDERTENTGEPGPSDAAMGDIDMSKDRPAPAAGESAEESFVYRRSASLSPESLTAKDFLGARLIDSSDEELAQVVDVIVEPAGQAIGVVLAAGGLFGLGADNYAVDFDRVTAETADGKVTMRSALSESDVERLRDFDYAGFKGDTRGMLLATQLRGAEVTLGEADQTGQLDDLIMDDGGTLQAVVLLHEGDRLVVPFDQVTLREDRTVTIDLAPEELAELAVFEGRRGAPARRSLLGDR